MAFYTVSSLNTHRSAPEHPISPTRKLLRNRARQSQTTRFADGAAPAASGRDAATLDISTSPASRPLQGLIDSEIHARLTRALACADGLDGAHCIHELWMRGEMPLNIERALERLWRCAAPTIPEWLPMRHVDWLPLAYEVALGFKSSARGRSNIYLVLLDYRDRGDPYGVYVGMSKYSPAQRFDQHKSGIRAAGSVLKRGVEVLTGPTLHLQFIGRGEAGRIEIQLAESLAAAGLMVKGGH